MLTSPLGAPCTCIFVDTGMRSLNLREAITCNVTRRSVGRGRVCGRLPCTVPTHLYGRAIAEAVSRWLPTAATRVRARVWQVGFVVDKMASGQVFSEYFGFPCRPQFIPPPSPSSQSPGTGTRSQVMAAVPRGPSMDTTSRCPKNKIK
jgi:hypothetical protein